MPSSLSQGQWCPAPTHPPPLPWALPSPALASSTRPAVGASLFRGQAAVPRDPLAWTGLGAWVGKTISSAPREACDVVAETDPTQGDLFMTNTVLASIIHDEHLGRCSEHTGQCFLLFPPPLPLKTRVKSAPGRETETGIWGGRGAEFPQGSACSRPRAPSAAPWPGICTQKGLWTGHWDL